MKYKDCETQTDIVDYYEDLIDFLGDHIHCLDELIALYEEGMNDN